MNPNFDTNENPNVQYEKLLMQVVRVLYPESSWGYDNDGQLVIYTGMFWDVDAQFQDDEDNSTKEVQA